MNKYRLEISPESTPESSPKNSPESSPKSSPDISHFALTQLKFQFLVKAKFPLETLSQTENTLSAGASIRYKVHEKV